MLDLSRLDLDEIAQALADQTDYEHRWLINPDTGEIGFWTSDTSIDGQTPVDLDELDELSIDPLPSYVCTWPTSASSSAPNAPVGASRGRSRDGAPSAGSKTSSTRSSRTCCPVWSTFRDSRARHRAVEWLADNSLIDDQAATRYLAEHSDPDLP